MGVTHSVTETKLLTGEELLEMGDIGRCELIDGQIIKLELLGAEHGLVTSNLAAELRSFVRQHKLGWVTGGEVGIYTRRNPDRVRGADIAFVANQTSTDRPKGFLEIAPDLIVEIMSPNDRWLDVHQKLEEYFEIGVKQVWVVEPENRAVRRYRSVTDVQKLTETDTLIGDGILAGFELPVAEIFAE
ncbi:MAG: Uma2 family endonuclease [Anaerolineae bacterium]|nr:Uma2 family endonuclease [Anaerolineae bacterium]